MQTTTPPITFDPAARGPLHGVRILDLSRLVAGNMLSLQLASRSQREESMSEGFTIANFRHVAKGLQPGQFAVGERKKAVGLADLDPIYKQLLDQPVYTSRPAPYALRNTSIEEVA
jgi:hypothetical protein